MVKWWRKEEEKSEKESKVEDESWNTENDEHEEKAEDDEEYTDSDKEKSAIDKPAKKKQSTKIIIPTNTSNNSLENTNKNRIRPKGK